MIIENELKYSYNDVMIVPAVLSPINHRSDCDLGDKLPLLTSPMDSVVNQENYELWKKYGITPILPRTKDNSIETRCAMKDDWVAMGLEELRSNWKICGNKVLLDIANGHMRCIYDLVRVIRSERPEMKIIVGNIANPETYLEAAKAGCWGVRLSVGTGCGCITASNTAIHYPIASLIDEVKKLKDELERSHTACPKIIADGGVRNYSDAVKALALGADYVMIGSVFAKMLESASPVLDEKTGHPISKEELKEITYGGGKFFNKSGEEVSFKKEYWGMASGRGQESMSGKKTKTAEGIVKTLPVQYTMEAWVNNFKDYLRSAMSYTGSYNLAQFRHSKLIIVSAATRDSINK